MADEVLRVAEVAARLQVTPETVKLWLRAGTLRGFRLGGDRAGWRIRAEDLEAFMERRMNVPAEAAPTQPTWTMPETMARLHAEMAGQHQLPALPRPGPPPPTNPTPPNEPIAGSAPANRLVPDADSLRRAP